MERTAPIGVTNFAITPPEVTSAHADGDTLSVQMAIVAVVRYWSSSSPFLSVHKAASMCML